MNHPRRSRSEVHELRRTLTHLRTLKSPQGKQLTVRQLAILLGVSKSRVQQMIDEDS
jgi:Mn-dependent DtxR family transcriptional regulator